MSFWILNYSIKRSPIPELHLFGHCLSIHVVVILCNQLICAPLDFHEFEVNATAFVGEACQVLAELTQLPEMQLPIPGILYYNY